MHLSLPSSTSSSAVLPLLSPNAFVQSLLLFSALFLSLAFSGRFRVPFVGLATPSFAENTLSSSGSLQLTSLFFYDCPFDSLLPLLQL